MTRKLQQGQVIELEITDLNTSGEGVGRYEGQVIFVPNTVTGDHLKVKIIQSKPKFARGKIQNILLPSPHRIRPQCIVADKCGGCQWQHIDINYQRQAKHQQIIQAFQRIADLANIQVEPILYTQDSLNYRNKSTYPLGRSATGQVQAGYYRQGSHKLVNLNLCPIQDERLNPFLKEIKQDIQARGWSIYDEHKHRGKLRHLSLRIGHHTGEILLTLIATSEKLLGIKEQAQLWLEKYPQLVGVSLNLNPQRTNTILGNTTYTIAGKSYLREIFAGIELKISADTFFQINTKAAELLFQSILDRLDLTGQETVIDAYCGIGTFSLPLAKKVQKIVGIEVNSESIKQAQNNAKLNNIDNAIFYTGKVRDWIDKITFHPDIFLLDPPRKGCHFQVIEAILKIKPLYIVYVSCKPATLARDIKLICQSNIYKPKYIQPTDFFPQTTHVESYVILRRNSQ